MVQITFKATPNTSSNEAFDKAFNAYSNKFCTVTAVLGGSERVISHLYDRKSEIARLNKNFKDVMDLPNDLDEKKKLVLDFHKISDLSKETLNDKKQFYDYLIKTKKFEPLKSSTLIKKFAIGTALYSGFTYLFLKACKAYIDNKSKK